MSRYKDIDLCSKIIKKEFSSIESSGVSMYKKGRRDGLVLANGILKDDKRIPVSDVVEVVRCKDCKYAKKSKDVLLEVYLGVPDYECLKTGITCLDADDFCSYGEREDEE